MKNWRINVVLVLIIILGVAIISRLFNIQILNHKFYQSQALGQQAGFSEAQGQRGEIFLKNSQESKGAYGIGDVKSLAINKERWAVSLIPQEIEDKAARKTKNSIIFEGSVEWPVLMLGPAASRVCNNQKKPVFLYSKKDKDSHGAVRTPKDIDGVKALMHCSKFLGTYGGHAQAADRKSVKTDFFNNLGGQGVVGHR